MEKFPQQNNTLTFTDKAKKVVRGIVLGTMIGVGSTGSQEANAQTNNNNQEQTHSNKETVREMRAGKETFIIKKSNASFRFDKGPIDKVIHHNHALKIFYGMSSSHHESPFEVLNIYVSKNNPNIIIVEGNGVKPIETINNGSISMFFAKSKIKIFYKKNNTGIYTEIGYKEESENYFRNIDDYGNWKNSNAEPK